MLFRVTHVETAVLRNQLVLPIREKSMECYKKTKTKPKVIRKKQTSH